MAKNLKKILIADDEKPMAHALELKLNSHGYEARAVYNGEEVLRAAEKEKFDLILLDLVMPKVDGFGVLSELKNRKNKTPIIILSNLSQEEDAKRAKELGAAGYFIKSNTPIAEIVNQVDKILK